MGEKMRLLAKNVGVFDKMLAKLFFSASVSLLGDLTDQTAKNHLFSEFYHFSLPVKSCDFVKYT